MIPILFLLYFFVLTSALNKVSPPITQNGKMNRHLAFRVYLNNFVENLLKNTNQSEGEFTNFVNILCGNTKFKQFKNNSVLLNKIQNSLCTFNGTDMDLNFEDCTNNYESRNESRTTKSTNNNSSSKPPTLAEIKLKKEYHIPKSFHKENNYSLKKKEHLSLLKSIFRSLKKRNKKKSTDYLSPLLNNKNLNELNSSEIESFSMYLIDNLNPSDVDNSSSSSETSSVKIKHEDKVKMLNFQYNIETEPTTRISIQQKNSDDSVIHFLKAEPPVNKSSKRRFEKSSIPSDDINRAVNLLDYKKHASIGLVPVRRYNDSNLGPRVLMGTTDNLNTFTSPTTTQLGENTRSTTIQLEGNTKSTTLDNANWYLQPIIQVYAKEKLDQTAQSSTPSVVRKTENEMSFTKTLEYTTDNSKFHNDINNTSNFVFDITTNIPNVLNNNVTSSSLMPIGNLGIPEITLGAYQYSISLGTPILSTSSPQVKYELSIHEKPTKILHNIMSQTMKMSLQPTTPKGSDKPFIFNITSTSRIKHTSNIKSPMDMTNLPPITYGNDGFTPKITQLNELNTAEQGSTKNIINELFPMQETTIFPKTESNTEKIIRLIPAGKKKAETSNKNQNAFPTTKSVWIKLANNKTNTKAKFVQLNSKALYLTTILPYIKSNISKGINNTVNRNSSQKDSKNNQSKRKVENSTSKLKYKKSSVKQNISTTNGLSHIKGSIPRFGAQKILTMMTRKSYKPKSRHNRHHSVNLTTQRLLRNISRSKQNSLYLKLSRYFNKERSPITVMAKLKQDKDILKFLLENNMKNLNIDYNLFFYLNKLLQKNNKQTRLQTEKDLRMKYLQKGFKEKTPLNLIPFYFSINRGL